MRKPKKSKKPSIRNNKNVYGMKIKEYGDGLEDFLNVLNDLSAEITDAFTKYGMGMGKHLLFDIDDTSKINPTFYPVISTMVSSSNNPIKFGGEWKIMMDKVESNYKKKREEHISKSLPSWWTNVSPLWPRYKDMGLIVIYNFEKEIGNISTEDKFDWSVDISQIYRMLKDFSSKSSPLSENEFNAIKYIISELVANTFQHAFPKTEPGMSSLGLFLNEETGDLQFTIADRGISIAKSVMNNNKIKKAGAAISWALGKGNTTKTSENLGGRGLYRVDEIIKKSGGTLAIRANKGFYHREKDKIIDKTVFYSVSGTYVYIKLNLKNIPNDIIKMNKKIEEETKGTFI